MVREKLANGWDLRECEERLQKGVRYYCRGATLNEARRMAGCGPARLLARLTMRARAWDAVWAKKEFLQRAQSLGLS